MSSRERFVLLIAAAPSTLGAIALFLWMAWRVAAGLDAWPEDAPVFLMPLISSVPVVSVMLALALRPRARHR